MSAKNKWLIKSDNRILGPYSYEQVEDLIMKKQIALIDEIRDMDTRWSYVRELTEFKPLVEKVRELIDNKSDMTQTMQTSQKTMTMTTTENADATKTHSLPVFSGITVASNTPASLPLEAHRPSIPESSASTREKMKKPDSLGVAGVGPLATPPQAVAPPWGSRLLIALGAALIIGGGYWYYDVQFGQAKVERTVSQQIRRAHVYAQDDRAVALFKTLPKETQDKVLLDIISLWPKLQANGAASYERLLDLSTSGKIIGNERKSQFQLVKFKKALELSDTKNANDALIKAIDLDSSLPDVKENEATFAFFSKKFPEAAKAFKSLYEQTGRGRFLYGYILSALHAQTLQVQPINALIEKHFVNRVDFNKELLFLQIFILKKFVPENTVSLEKALFDFVTFPVQLSRQFRMSQLVFDDVYEWEQLVSLHGELAPKLTPEQNALVEIQFDLEMNSLPSAEEKLNRKIIDSHAAANAEIALRYLQNNAAQAVALEKAARPLYLSSQLELLLIKKQLRVENAQLAPHLAAVGKLKNLISNWAQLAVLNYPQDRDRMRALIQADSQYENDFLPYLNAKASFNE